MQKSKPSQTWSKCKITYQKGGFTLIEILVTVFILAILMSVGFASYARLNQRQKLIAAGETMKTLLRDAQNRASNGEVDCSAGKCSCDLDGTSSLVGWYADFTSPGRIYGECQGNIEFGEKPFGLSDEIVITKSVDKLLFRNNPPSADNQALICLNLQNETGSYYVIKVNRAGSVYDAGDIRNTCE